MESIVAYLRAATQLRPMVVEALPDPPQGKTWVVSTSVGDDHGSIAWTAVDESFAESVQAEIAADRSMPPVIPAVPTERR